MTYKEVNQIFDNTPTLEQLEEIYKDFYDKHPEYLSVYSTIIINGISKEELQEEIYFNKLASE